MLFEVAVIHLHTAVQWKKHLDIHQFQLVNALDISSHIEPFLLADRRQIYIQLLNLQRVELLIFIKTRMLLKESTFDIFRKVLLGGSIKHRFLAGLLKVFCKQPEARKTFSAWI